jgi:probable rRNA maturation factor
MPEIINRQRKIKINLQELQRFTEKAIETAPESRGKFLMVAFISDKTMRELNREFRGQDSTTDVLSFPYQTEEFEIEDSNLGDIIISAEQAQRQARENNLELETELKQLILHGILHLCGYDHETDDGEMNALELELRERLNIA